MALLDSFSCECVKSELDLFSVPPTQTSIEQTFYKEYYPVSLIEANAPLEFHVIGAEDEYLDLQQSFLYITASIRKRDGSAINPPVGQNEPSDASYVFPINYFAATQFKNIEVILSGVQVSPNDVLYPYRSWIESTLTYGSSKKEQLQAGFYYPDKNAPDIHDKTVAEEECRNEGARTRFNLTRYSKKFEMITRVHHSLFNQPKLLLGKVDLRLKFHRHDPKFCLMAFSENVGYSIQIDKAVLNICHKRVSPSVRESHEIGLLKTPAKYPLRLSEMKFFTKAQGTADLSEPNLYTGILPRRVVIGLVSSTAYNGSYLQNPLNFQSFNLSSIQLRKNGTTLPFEELKLDFDDEHVLFGYMSLFQGMGRLFTNETMDMTWRDYIASGQTLYVFDLSQDATESNLSLLQEGKLSLHIKLGRALQESCTVIAYLEKEGLIEIDKERNVTLEG